MPKSKRDKNVSLTKVKKRVGRERKASLVEEIRKCVHSYQRLFVFSMANSRNSKLKDIRQTFKADSRFFFGKNRVMALALGRIKEEEYNENLHKVSRRMTGQCGLMFTNRDVEDVRKFFQKFHASDFARSGNIATSTVKLDQGPLERFQFSIEPQLRKLGLPTTLRKGVVTLLEDFTVCKEGEKLTPEQAKLLKLFDLKLADFQVNLLCQWTRKGGQFRNLIKRDKNETNAVDN